MSEPHSYRVVACRAQGGIGDAVSSEYVEGVLKYNLGSAKYPDLNAQNS
jgi:hypothetical protein